MNYEKPTMELILLEEEDVIVTSELSVKGVSSGQGVDYSDIWS